MYSTLIRYSDARHRCYGTFRRSLFVSNNSIRGRRFLSSSEEEIEAFNKVQKALSRPTTLAYFNIDLDVLKKRGIGAMIYCLKKGYEFDPKGFPARTAVKPIIFFSKMLNAAERKYWPIEMEVAGLV